MAQESADDFTDELQPERGNQSMKSAAVVLCNQSDCGGNLRILASL